MSVKALVQLMGAFSVKFGPGLLSERRQLYHSADRRKRRAHRPDKAGRRSGIGRYARTGELRSANEGITKNSCLLSEARTMAEQPYAEHEPWVGERYDRQPVDRRFAIVGYRHQKGCSDCRWVTTCAVDEVFAGTEPTVFFDRIRDTFGAADNKFWRNVIFFNFLPDMIDRSEQPNGPSAAARIHRGKARFMEILQTYRPDKTFVFSRKAWAQMPQTLEEANGGTCSPISADLPDSFQLGTYHIADRDLQVFGLRHPQLAHDGLLKRAVRDAIELQVANP